MSKRYISIFLPAALTLMLVGVGALLGAYECHRYVQTGDGHERFETFIQNVQSGHLEVTTAPLAQARSAAAGVSHGVL